MRVQRAPAPIGGGKEEFKLLCLRLAYHPLRPALCVLRLVLLVPGVDCTQVAHVVVYEARACTRSSWLTLDIRELSMHTFERGLTPRATSPI